MPNNPQTPDAPDETLSEPQPEPQPEAPDTPPNEEPRPQAQPQPGVPASSPGIDLPQPSESPDEDDGGDQ